VQNQIDWISQLLIYGIGGGLLTLVAGWTVKYVRRRDRIRSLRKLVRLLTDQAIQFDPEAKRLDNAQIDRAELLAGQYLKRYQFLPSKVLIRLGNAELGRSNYQRAEQYYLSVLEIEQDEVNTVAGLAGYSLGLVYHWTGRSEEAALRFERSRDVFQQISDEIGQANALECLVQISFLKNEYDKSQEMLEEILRLTHHVEDKRHHIYCLRRLGDVTWAQGNPQQALSYLKKALYLHDEFMVKEGRDELLDEIKIVREGIE
jgi:tetratricopeptide (TPR) repeat protein